MIDEIRSDDPSNRKDCSREHWYKGDERKPDKRFGITPNLTYLSEKEKDDYMQKAMEDGISALMNADRSVGTRIGECAIIAKECTTNTRYKLTFRRLRDDEEPEAQ